jgi:hypothetical protein
MCSVTTIEPFHFNFYVALHVQQIAAHSWSLYYIPYLSKPRNELLLQLLLYRTRELTQGTQLGIGVNAVYRCLILAASSTCYA